jgi:hypothetical protein
LERFIKISGYPPDHARKAYDNGYFLEAIQTLHGFLERKLQEFLLMQRVPKNGVYESWSKAWDVSVELSLNNAGKALFVIKAISEDELNKISKFNRVRNNIIHKLFYDHHDEKWLGLKKEEYDELFETGMALCDEIDSKSSELNL